MSPSEVNRQVEAYLRKLSCELPGSSAKLLDQIGGNPAHDDSKLIRLVRLGRDGRLFALCEDDHVRVLIARAGSVVEGTVVDEDGETMTLRCRPRGPELARALGMSYRKYRGLVTEANKRVELALERLAA